MMNVGQTVSCHYYLSIHKATAHEVFWEKSGWKSSERRGLLDTWTVYTVRTSTKESVGDFGGGLLAGHPIGI